MRYWLFGLLAALAALTYAALALSVLAGIAEPKYGWHAVVAVLVWLAAMIGLAHSPVPKD